jgi:hypothetical protein
MPSLRLSTTIVICAALNAGSALGQSSPAKTLTLARTDGSDRSGLGCPPGTWVCPQETSQPALPALPPAPAPPVIAYGPSEEPSPVAPPPAPAVDTARRRGGTEWGGQLRLEAMGMGNQAAKGAGMGGFGLSLRPRPTPHFAIDCGIDFLGGIDFRGYSRDEVAFLVNPMVFLNPQDKVQVYLLGGVGFSWAHLDNPDGAPIRYSYVGIDAGTGLEWRFSRHMAFGGDLVLFVRGRTDPEASRQPEFVERKYPGRTTNASGGALLRTGLTFYW